MSIKIISKTEDGFVICEENGTQFQLPAGDKRLETKTPTHKKSELNKLKKDELLVICTELEITSTGEETNKELVELILEASKN